MLTDLSAQVKKLIISLLHLLSSKEDSDQQLNKRDISSRQVGSKNKKVYIRKKRRVAPPAAQFW